MDPLSKNSVGRTAYEEIELNSGEDSSSAENALMLRRIVAQSQVKKRA